MNGCRRFNTERPIHSRCKGRLGSTRSKPGAKGRLGSTRCKGEAGVHQEQRGSWGPPGAKGRLGSTRSKGEAEVHQEQRGGWGPPGAKGRLRSTRSKGPPGEFTAPKQTTIRHADSALWGPSPHQSNAQLGLECELTLKMLLFINKEMPYEGVSI